MDELSSRFTIQNVVLREPFVNRSLTGHYQKLIQAVAIRYSGRCGKMVVVERLELELIHRTSAGTEKSGHSIEVAVTGASTFITFFPFP